ncbi:MAG: DUF1570 domain-containing protein [Planctomycetes bacterium]|nr:DUF1570 domain-containing protein [Planctomycetota bacterium]
MKRPLLTALLALLALCLPAAAQGGYSKERYPEHGLTFELARKYEWLAIQPNERWVVLQWQYDDGDAKAPGGRGNAPMLQIVRIDYVPDPGPETPGGMGPGKSGGEEPPDAGTGKPSGAGAPADEDEPPPPPPINSWPRYLEQRLNHWSATKVGSDKPRDDYEPSEYELIYKRGRGDVRGFAYVWEKSRTRTFVVLGWCTTDRWDEQVDIWRKTAEKMRFEEPVPDPELVKWQRYYERRPKFKDPEYRIRVRKQLNGDWQAEDTENYIVIYDTPDQPLVRRIVKDMESIREEYVRLFPAVGEIEAVSTVRVCADRDEYMAYGGPGGSAGYWNWVTEELVLYDGTKREKGKPTDKLDTFIVLYHEAFHQYIHYSAGELAPHSWFNEGYGDFFSGAQIKGGKVKKIEPNRWRVATIKNAVQRLSFTPWRDIIEYEQAQYYNRATVGVNYAQGWSMIYFLNTSKKVQRDEAWSRILPTYFETLKSSWKAELKKLEADGDEEDVEKRGAAQLRARQAAVKAAFEGVDLDALEAEWIDFVNGLEP